MEFNNLGFRIFDHCNGKVSQFSYKSYEMSMSTLLGGGVAVYNKDYNFMGSFDSVEIAIEWVNKCQAST